jgi:ATP-dependent Lon protease
MVKERQNKKTVIKDKTDKKDKKNKKITKKEYNKKKDESSDSDSDSDSDCNSISESDEEENNEKEEMDMDMYEYRKFLSKIFPSKYLTNKIKAEEKYKKKIEEIESVYSNEDGKEIQKNKKIKKNIDSSSNEEDDEEYEDDEDDEEDEEYEEYEEDEENEEDEEDEEYKDEEDFISKNKSNNSRKKNEKVNIIFTIGNSINNEYEEEMNESENNEYLEDYETEDENDSISDSDKGKGKDKSKNNKKKLKNECLKQEKSIDKLSEIGVTEESANIILEKLKEMKSQVNDNLIDKCLKMVEDELKEKEQKSEKIIKKIKDRNARIFKKILRDKNVMNDLSFFENLEIEEQKKILKEIREINKIIRIEKPYRLSLLESNIPQIFKATAMKKISSLRHMEPGSGEYFKLKNWVDNFMRIPFDKYEKLPINIEDGIDKCHEFMENAQKILDSAVYGLNDAKMQIMQLLGQLITNPQAIGTAIAVHGKMGTGKTSLIKEGVSKILNRPFAFIALGGATDSSFLEGHSYTYEGSIWGKIVQILIDSKCMNPIIYFDELDKISDTPKGEEIAGILTHLTDTSQNSQFHDKYFSEIDFDLSKCIFIFSYNDENKVNPILKDRMYKIKTDGYNKKEKTIISNKYLLPRIKEQIKFGENDIIIPDNVLHYIIENHCNKEEGVRNLKRALEIIYTKLNLYRLMKPNTNLFEQEMALKVEFPFTVTIDIVNKLIKKEREEFLNPSLYGLYV